MKMKLNIQLFAEDGVVTDNVDVNNETPVVEKQEVNFTDLLNSNKEYQRDFDRLVAKATETAITNAKSKWDAERSEAEKLAKMDADQKIKYELNKLKEEKQSLEGQLNSMNLYRTASDIAVEKNIPQSYLDLIDFSRETAESVSAKLDKIALARSKDLESYLNEKLRQPTPQESDDDYGVDPYVEGFLSEF